jgi:hypothetical protein
MYKTKITSLILQAPKISWRAYAYGSLENKENHMRLITM